MISLLDIVDPPIFDIPIWKLDAVKIYSQNVEELTMKAFTEPSFVDRKIGNVPSVYANKITDDLHFHKGCVVDDKRFFETDGYFENICSKHHVNQKTSLNEFYHYIIDDSYIRTIDVLVITDDNDSRMNYVIGDDFLVIGSCVFILGFVILNPSDMDIIRTLIDERIHQSIDLCKTNTKIIQRCDLECLLRLGNIDERITEMLKVIPFGHNSSYGLQLDLLDAISEPTRLMQWKVVYDDLSIDNCSSSCLNSKPYGYCEKLNWCRQYIYHLQKCINKYINYNLFLYEKICK